MEHIRAAIDKARQERQLSGNTGKDSAQQTTASDDAALSLEWEALQRFDVSPKWLKRNRITTQRASHQATPFDAMRTKLLHELRSNNWRRVAITSPGTSCGKTTICLNLAFSMARQANLRVMVIELDLRRPAIARMLKLGKQTDFAKVLTGHAPASDHIWRYGEGLAVAASQVTINPSELLQGLSAAHTIDKIEARYQPDVMLFDMPPMLVVDDTMAFIDQVDATLLVGAAEASTIDQLGRCTHELEDRTNLLGVILNKCRYLDSTENYGYGV